MRRKTKQKKDKKYYLQKITVKKNKKNLKNYIYYLILASNTGEIIQSTK